MIHTPRPPTQPPLCVIRREAAEHRVSIDRATCDLRVSRAGFQSQHASLSDRMSEIRRRLDAAQTSLTSTGPAPIRAAAFCADAPPPAGKPNRDGTRTVIARPTSAESPRQTRLRLYSPPSSV